MFPLLSLVTFLPLLGGIAVLFFPKERPNLIRWTALGVAWADLLIVLGLMLAYSQANLAAGSTIVGSSPTSTFLANVNEQTTWISTAGFTLNYGLGVDGISLLLVALTALLTVVCIAASFSIDLKELYGLYVAFGVWYHRRFSFHHPLPLLYFLGTDADSGIFPGRKLGR